MFGILLAAGATYLAAEIASSVRNSLDAAQNTHLRAVRDDGVDKQRRHELTMAALKEQCRLDRAAEARAAEAAQRAAAAPRLAKRFVCQHIAERNAQPTGEDFIEWVRSLDEVRGDLLEQDIMSGGVSLDTMAYDLVMDQYEASLAKPGFGGAAII